MFKLKPKFLYLTIGTLAFLIAIILSGRLYFQSKANSKLSVNTSASSSAFWQKSDLKIPKSSLVAKVSLPPHKVSKLDGRAFPAEIKENLISVVIENHPGARPQMEGLEEANIVFEVLAEGGITRYLAVFDTTELDKVGPVRSARPYLVDWAEEFGGSFVHAGGSYEAIQKLRKSELFDIEEVEGSDVVYRDFQFLVPHNLFVDLKKAKEEAIKPEIQMGKFEKSWFNFSEKIPASAETVKQFSLDFSFPSYFVDYVFDPVSNSYSRLLGGSEHISASGEKVKPTNIIVQFTEYWPIDEEGRLELRTTGTGIAWYFSGGKFWEGSWVKNSERTLFLDAENKPISLQPGQTFIEIIDSPEKIEIQNRQERDISELTL